MKKKLFLMGMLGMVLAFIMTFFGCASSPRSFQKGTAGDTTVLLRDGLDFDRAFREVAFILNRHGFNSDTLQPEVGYIRTTWNYQWNDTGNTIETYRVRVICNFNPSRTQLILKVEAETSNGKGWISGFDTRAVETLRTDITQSIGN
jgi:hypothetical protein